jgi:hypothetical protein
MPDIIEENEGEGMSVIERRARAFRFEALERAARAARAARLAAERNNNDENNNNNNNNNRIHPEPPADVPQVDVVADNGGDPLATEIGMVADHVSRLVPGVDVRPMFRRLGVTGIADLCHVRERDVDGITRINAIQKRKLWAIIKYLGTTDNNTLTERTSLRDIVKALNSIKKKEKDKITHSTSASASASSASVALIPSMTVLTSGVVPMVQISKLEPFDGSHSNWLQWKCKAQYALAQTPLGPLIIQDDNNKAEDTQETQEKYALKYPGQDTLLFNILAEALVDGCAKFVIHKAKKQSLMTIAAAAATGTASSSNSSSSSTTTTKKGNTSSPSTSGRVLWQVLQQEYSQGPRAFWILSDARQILQNLRLVSPMASSSVMVEESAMTQPTPRDENLRIDDEFNTPSANAYAQRFRSAKETLEEFHQALPEAFLASTFVEHIVDDRFDKIKQQLLQDITTKDLSLDDCITELLMTEHMLKLQDKKQSSNRNKKQRGRIRTDAGRRKRTLEDHSGNDQHEDKKRRKLLEAGGDVEDGDDSENKRDETIS